MVNHYVFWCFHENVKEDEKEEIFLKIKNKLENVKQYVEGLISFEIIRNDLSSSNRDIALLTKFNSLEDLKNYQEHPAHIEAGKYINTVVCQRACFDFEQ